MANHEHENLGLIVAVSVVATIGGFLFGFDSGVINGTVKGLQRAFDSDSVGTGFNVASMLLGCAAGAFFAARLADRFGRRSLLIVSASFFLVSAWGSGIAGGSAEFVFFRIIGGLAVGAASVLAPAYIAEIAPARMRGTLATVQQIAIIVGLFAAFLSNYLIAALAGSSEATLWWGFAAWRWMFWIELLPAAFFLLGLLFIPESPRYLVLAGASVRSREVFTRLFGEELALAKVTEIEVSLSDARQRPRLSDVFLPGTRRLRTIVWVGLGLAVFQQLVGINVVFYYGAVLWQAVGFSESDALMINVITGGISIVACLITLTLIDRIGRRIFLLVGSVGMTLALVTMAAAFSTASLDAQGVLRMGDLASRSALLAALGYAFLFNMSWGPVMWVMLGEMFPNQLRGSGLAISGLAQWLANFAITITFPVLLAGIGLAGAYTIYAGFALLSVVFVMALVHETRGLELEDMPG